MRETDEGEEGRKEKEEQIIFLFEVRDSWETVCKSDSEG